MCHHPGAVLGEIRIEFAEDGHPGLDVATLRPPDLPLGRRRKVGKVAVLDPDEIGLAESEVQMELDQTGQGGGRIIGPGHHILPAGQ